MEEQRKVAEFIEEHDLEAAPGFRIMDLVSEVGEIAKDVTKSSEYGLAPEKMEIKEDEVGDALFSLLAVAEDLGIDAGEALDTALEKYRSRIEEKGEPGSG
ncbi:MAG: MazG nucleotide pyrophosphohydrolase domain-containing protein [Candidatus Nanohaloarchaea archaeon]